MLTARSRSSQQDTAAHMTYIYTSVCWRNVSRIARAEKSTLVHRKALPHRGHTHTHTHTWGRGGEVDRMVSARKRVRVQSDNCEQTQLRSRGEGKPSLSIVKRIQKSSQVSSHAPQSYHQLGHELHEQRLQVAAPAPPSMFLESVRVSK